ncbi:4427_t:CDS:1 [Acaulospora colombiana]|uniref:4427_t:CDS:1 n=1 Tax=Acaulospora colombiana TaxID=27376 RepID=A0ACA9QBV0_9GLOM|nr:4427_t:CDS:1 [Acaulospora colombiana]
MNTPITPNPNHAYLYTGVMPSPLSPQGYGGPTSGYPPPEKPSRHTSLVHQPPQLRSSVRQMHPRPRDWEIEEESIIQNLQPTPLPVPRVTTTDTTTNLTNTTTQTPTSAMPPIINITPTSALPSPAFTGPFPSPHPSTRRSRSRPKEYLDLPAELQIPPPPLQNTYPLSNFNVPILREPNAGMRRGRRRNTESAAQAQHAPIQGQGGLAVPLQEAVMTENGLEYARLYDPYSGAYNGGPVLYRHGTMGHERSVSEDNDARLQGYHPSQHHHEAYHGMMQNIHNLAPVVRRVSLTHPAPPAYSPPRLIRNADPERDML